MPLYTDTIKISRSDALNKKKPELVYQLKITLNDIKPPIWRRFIVSAAVKLPDLHKIIQTVMGWTNSHLHMFVIDGKPYSPPDEESSLDMVDYRKIRLNSVITREKQKFSYEYDFGDGWEHILLVEKILPEDDSVRYPVCTAGKRNCPPEDCGGPWGYEDLLTIIRDPGHAEYKEMREWLSDDFDPEAFDLKQINKMLQQKDFGCLIF